MSEIIYLEVIDSSKKVYLPVEVSHNVFTNGKEVKKDIEKFCKKNNITEFGLSARFNGSNKRCCAMFYPNDDANYSKALVEKSPFANEITFDYFVYSGQEWTKSNDEFVQI